MWSVLLASSLAAPCAQRASSEEVRAEVERLAALPAEARHAALPALLEALGCAAAPLSAEGAGALHRLVGADAAWAGDEVRARAADAAADRIAAGGAPGASGLLEAFGTSLAARVYVDGVETASRVVGQPAVVQVFDGSGGPLGGAWVAPGDPLPDWVAFPDLQCTEAVAVEGILRDAAEAEAAWLALDVPGFERELMAVASALPCVTTRIGPAQAAAIHRLEGLRQFAHGAQSAALRSFQEARLLDPTFEPSPEAVRPESTLAEVWARAGATGSGGYLLEDVPAGLRLDVDGVPSSVRPAALPAIVQVSDALGVVSWTRYVPPGSRLPDLAPYGVLAAARRAAAVSPARALYARMAERGDRDARRVGLVTGSALAYTLAGGAYVVHAQGYDEYMDRDTPQTELPKLRRQVNAAASVSAGALAAGTALLVGAVFAR